MENNIPQNTEVSSTKRMKHNVIFPNGKEQKYYTMLDFGGKTEIDVIELCMKRDKAAGKNVTTIFFMSPPGLGKTVLGGHMAKELNCPYQVLNCVSTMADLDLLGQMILVGMETVWQDGPITSIIRATNESKQGILIINEFNALSLTAQMALNSLLDKQQSVVLTINNNEMVRVSQDSHLLVIASMNPDVMGINEIQDSVRDRANLIIHMDYPSVTQESILISNLTGFPTDITRKFCEVIAECRALKTRDLKLTKAPSTRGLIDWINYSKSLGVKTAFELCVVGKYGTSSEERSFLSAVAKGKGISEDWIDELKGFSCSSPIKETTPEPLTLEPLTPIFMTTSPPTSVRAITPSRPIRARKARTYGTSSRRRWTVESAQERANEMGMHVSVNDGNLKEICKKIRKKERLSK